MTLFDWLDKQYTFNNRLECGGRAIAKVFNRDLLASLLQVVLLIVMAIVWVPLYFIGWFSEWRSNRRDGITTVKE